MLHRQRPGSGRGRTYLTCMGPPRCPDSNGTIPVRFRRLAMELPWVLKMRGKREDASAEARERSWQDVPYMYRIPLPSRFLRCRPRPILTTRHGVTWGFRKERTKGSCIGRGQGAAAGGRTLHGSNPLAVPIPMVPSPSDSDDSP
jgi:hypothetical protein